MSREDSARRAYEAGCKAKAEGQPMRQHNGWGLPEGRYYWHFAEGYRGRAFQSPLSDSSERRYEAMRQAGPGSITDIYAEGKARKLIAEEFRRAGQESHAKQYETGGFSTAPLRAFSRYIASRE
jgi:hypothetical protein